MLILLGTTTNWLGFELRTGCTFCTANAQVEPSCASCASLQGQRPGWIIHIFLSSYRFSFFTVSTLYIGFLSSPFWGSRDLELVVAKVIVTNPYHNPLYKLFWDLEKKQIAEFFLQLSANCWRWIFRFFSNGHVFGPWSSHPQLHHRQSQDHRDKAECPSGVKSYVWIWKSTKRFARGQRSLDVSKRRLVTSHSPNPNINLGKNTFKYPQPSI